MVKITLGRNESPVNGALFHREFKQQKRDLSESLNLSFCLLLTSNEQVFYPTIGKRLEPFGRSTGETPGEFCGSAQKPRRAQGFCEAKSTVLYFIKSTRRLRGCVLFMKYACGGIPRGQRKRKRRTT